ncbi:TPA: ABC transporter ATP-binding protein [Burkholderia cepacia]|uniref:ABC transporter ATP-binding protein n=1 Tax=Burkholderia cepacia TaxID=292 RepID=UPI001CF2B391|nr:ABC transporter ATP-binding protein [Burkholderia cepacia]MCA8361993.1 ABC transporter ATP-binding protein [Burkholderia cepacia]HDR9759589.1 ABC transporter ATP-binding protein [Burkholderia cepacia ATCC 25416]HDV6367347.1 ABC transporter ATP-binding protein [Burkholderia cepacia]
MIVLDTVSKYYPTRSGPRRILDGVTTTIGSGERIGILGRNGSGKSTLLRLLSGAEQPSAGSITRTLRVSWPLAFGGAFQSSLTGLDNLRFICRLYGVSFDEKIDFVESFTELGSYLREPVKRYSAGMRARLSFALSLAIDFDCYLIDEIIAVGDSTFHRKCEHELFERRGFCAFVLVSHDPHLIERYCRRAAVLKDGRFAEFGTVAEAYEFYRN